MTVAEIAENLQVSRTTVQKWIRSGDLPAKPMPNRGAGLRTHYRVDDHDYRVFLWKHSTHKRGRQPRKTNDPTPEEIAARCAEIRATWSRTEERKRRVVKNEGRVEIAVVREDEIAW